MIYLIVAVVSFVLGIIVKSVLKDKQTVDSKSKRSFTSKLNGVNQPLINRLSEIVYSSEPVIGGWVYYGREEYDASTRHDRLFLLYDNGKRIYLQFTLENNHDIAYVTCLYEDSGKFVGDQSKNSRITEPLMKKILSDLEKVNTSPILLRSATLRKDEICIGESPIIWNSDEWFKFAVKREDINIATVEVLDLWAAFTPVEITELKAKEQNGSSSNSPQ